MKLKQTSRCLLRPRPPVLLPPEEDKEDEEEKEEVHGKTRSKYLPLQQGPECTPVKENLKVVKEPPSSPPSLPRQMSIEDMTTLTSPSDEDVTMLPDEEERQESDDSSVDLSVSPSSLLHVPDFISTPTSSSGLFGVNIQDGEEDEDENDEEMRHLHSFYSSSPPQSPPYTRSRSPLFANSASPFVTLASPFANSASPFETSDSPFAPFESSGGVVSSSSSSSDYWLPSSHYLPSFTTTPSSSSSPPLSSAEYPSIFSVSVPSLIDPQEMNDVIGDYGEQISNQKSSMKKSLAKKKLKKKRISKSKGKFPKKKAKKKTKRKSKTSTSSRTTTTRTSGTASRTSGTAATTSSGTASRTSGTTATRRSQRLLCLSLQEEERKKEANKRRKLSKERTKRKKSSKKKKKDKTRKKKESSKKKKDSKKPEANDSLYSPRLIFLPKRHINEPYYQIERQYCDLEGNPRDFHDCAKLKLTVISDKREVEDSTSIDIDSNGSDQILCGCRLRVNANRFN